MLGPERRQKIMDILRQYNKVYVSQLAKIFNITKETIHRKQLPTINVGSCFFIYFFPASCHHQLNAIQFCDWQTRSNDDQHL